MKGSTISSQMGKKDMIFIEKTLDLFDYSFDSMANFHYYFPQNNAKNIIGKLKQLKKQNQNNNSKNKSKSLAKSKKNLKPHKK